MRLSICAAVLFGGLMATAAHAAPGLGDEVYGATVESGETEFEARYGQLDSGADDGEDNARFEVERGITNRLALAAVVELERDPGGTRRATHLGFEAIYHLGRVAGIDVAAYQELELGLNGDSYGSETKLLLQKRAGKWDLRFNLVGEKPFDTSAPLEFGYAASADVAVSQRFRLGITGFGDLGTIHDFGPSSEHFLGPVAKVRMLKLDPDGDGDDHGGLTLEAGYLFAIGATNHQTNGQFRLNLEWEM